MGQESRPISHSLHNMLNVPGLPAPAQGGWNIGGGQGGGSAVFPGAAATSEPLLPFSVGNPAGSELVNVVNRVAEGTVFGCAYSPKQCSKAMIGLAAGAVVAVGGFAAWQLWADSPSAACPPDNRALLDMLPQDLRRKIKAVEAGEGNAEERIERIASLLQRSPEAKGMLSLFSICELESGGAGGASADVRRSNRAVGGDGSDAFLQPIQKLVEDFKNGTGRISSIERVVDDLKGGLESAGISAGGARKVASSLSGISERVIAPDIARVSARIDRVSNLEEQDNVPVVHQVDILRQALIRAGLRAELSDLQRINSKVEKMILTLNRIAMNAAG